MSTKPWNMQPGETPKAYQAFEVYRDLGAERSVERAASSLSKTRQNLSIWAQRFDWSTRFRSF